MQNSTEKLVRTFRGNHCIYAVRLSPPTDISQTVKPGLVVRIIHNSNFIKGTGNSLINVEDVSRNTGCCLVTRCALTTERWTRRDHLAYIIHITCGLRLQFGYQMFNAFRIEHTLRIWQLEARHERICTVHNQNLACNIRRGLAEQEHSRVRDIFRVPDSS